MDASALFADLCTEYAGVTGVSVPDGTGRGFGADALKVHDKIFAMVVEGRLVVKLPRARVTELVETGHGAPFDAGRGTPMQEWVVLTGDEAEVRAQVTEAYAFVGQG